MGISGTTGYANPDGTSGTATRIQAGRGGPKPALKEAQRVRTRGVRGGGEAREHPACGRGRREVFESRGAKGKIWPRGRLGDRAHVQRGCQGSSHGVSPSAGSSLPGQRHLTRLAGGAVRSSFADPESFGSILTEFLSLLYRSRTSQRRPKPRQDPHP